MVPRNAKQWRGTASGLRRHELCPVAPQSYRWLRIFPIATSCVDAISDRVQEKDYNVGGGFDREAEYRLNGSCGTSRRIGEYGHANGTKRVD